MGRGHFLLFSLSDSPAAVSSGTCWVLCWPHTYIFFPFVGPASVTSQSPVPCKLCILDEALALCRELLPAALLLEGMTFQEPKWGGFLPGGVGTGHSLSQQAGASLVGVGLPMSSCLRARISYCMQIPRPGLSFSLTSSSALAKVGLRDGRRSEGRVLVAPYLGRCSLNIEGAW